MAAITSSNVASNAANSSAKGVFGDMSWVLGGQAYAHKRYNPRIQAHQNKIDAYVKATGAKPGVWHPLSIKEKLLKLRKSLLGQFLDYDFVSFEHYKKLKTTFSTTPRGALILFAFAGLEGARALKAWKRSWVKDSAGNKIKRDFREVRDVLIRDTWAITVYIWGLEVVNKWLINRGQKSSGIKLNHDFKAHEINRNFMDERGRLRVRNYIANFLHGNGEGMLKAVENNAYFGIPRHIFNQAQVAPEHVRTKLFALADKLAAFRSGQKSFYTTVQKYVPGVADTDIDFEARIDAVLKHEGKAVDTLLDNRKQEGVGLLRQIETLREELIEDLASKNGRVDGKLKTRLAKSWDKYSDFLVRAAKGKRTVIDAVSFAFILFLIGYLPVKFNEWYTNKEYKRLQDEHRRMQGMFHTVNNTQAPLHPQRYA